MSDAPAVSVHGVDHVAYVTYKPEETVRFYRDVLGFPLVHCILAPGWGKEAHPDFAHFFFDLGKGAKLAFFYYFGEEPYEDPASNLLQKARHLSIQVETKEELDEYERRMKASGYPYRHRVMHEVIESIYIYDPNGYNIEISLPMRSLDADDALDAALSLRAIIDVAREPEPSLAKVWARKGELIAEEV